MTMWHPLGEYIHKVNERAKDIEREAVIHNVTIPNFDMCPFYNRLETIKNYGDPDDYRLAKIFEPLIIKEQYWNGMNLALFKYNSYIILNELGYGSDFFELYDGLYRSCRSIVFDVDNEKVVLASLDKFKNYGEELEGDWSEKAVQKRIAESSHCYVTDKMDGSYQQFRWIREYESVLGSGSQSLSDIESWRLRKGYDLLDSNYKAMLRNSPDFTFCFEFVSPDNPIVVKYTKEQEGLYLFAARNVIDGREISIPTLHEIASYYNVKMVKWYENENLETVLSELDKYQSNEKEGWVFSIHSPMDLMKPFRVKIKTDDYVLIHKALAKSVSPNAIIRAVHDGKWDDFEAKIPEAYKDVASEVVNDVLDYLMMVSAVVHYYYAQMKKEVKNIENRKANMVWIETNVPKFMQGYVRSLYLEREVDYLKKIDTEDSGLYGLNEIRRRNEKLDKIYKEISIHF